MTRRLSFGREVIVAVLLLLACTAFTSLIFTIPTVPVAKGASTSPLLQDDFTQDTSLNTNLWQINGPVGSVVGPDDAGVNQIPLAPTFSPAGMTIAQINGSQEYGTIESIADFTPPFTVTGVVEGIVSNGHTFGLAISTQDASTGVLVYGNVNATNCSNLGNCGEPNICGNSANPSIPPNQCYYGLDVKVGQGGKWPHVAKLYLTPSVNVTYTLQISVNTAGDAQYSASQAGQVLGQGTAQVGTGPFYIIMEQVEGSPVAHPGPNEAIWTSVSVTPTTTMITTTATPGPGAFPAGFPTIGWVVIIIILILFFILLFWFTRKRGFTVTVVDSSTLSPILQARVTAEGPKDLSGLSDKDGKVKFGSVKEGDYVIKALAAGYNPSIPVKIEVKKRTQYTVRLDRAVGGAREDMGAGSPPAGPKVEIASAVPPATEAPPVSAPPVQQTPTPAVAQPEVAYAPAEDFEGLGGERIRQIIKTFQAKGAISPETALTAEELGLSRLFVRIMKRRRGKTMIFMEVNGRYYLNQDALKERK
jgi:hypothetical protein